MTGVGVSWSAPGWVGVSDGKYSELIQRKAVAVTRRDKRRGGKYSVKEAIEAIHEAFHRCNGSWGLLSQFRLRHPSEGSLTF